MGIIMTLPTKIAVIALLLPAFVNAAETTVHVSPQHAESGGWTYQLKRDDTLVPCRARQKPRCITNIIVIDNPSASTLECQAGIRYEGVNNEGQQELAKPAVMQPKQNRAVIRDFAMPDVAIAAHEVSCKQRAPLDMSRLQHHCKAHFDPSGIKLPEFYPPTSRRAAEEGSVTMEFSLSPKEQAPHDIVVVGSSLYPRLDRAAVEAMSRAMGATEGALEECETARYMFTINFKLTD
jgi:TonB family protein